MMIETKGDRPSDLGQHLFQLFGGDGAQGCPHGAHAAADIHPHRVGDHHLRGRHHPADGHAIALMGVRHHRHMPEEKGEIGKISGLLQSAGIDVVKPEFDGKFFGDNDLLHRETTLLFPKSKNRFQRYGYDKNSHSL